MEALAALLLFVVVIGLFGLIGKKMGALEQKDDNDDDFSCH
ncbi:hypothetical protein [Natroniella sulfidigena]|nr:hypothetical protein [Natroniella sulfidigena]